MIYKNLSINIFALIFISTLFLTTNFIAKDLELLKEKSFSVVPGQKLIVKTDLGDITIKTWNSNEVLISIYGDEDARRKMEFSFDQDDEGVKVIGEKQGSHFFSWFKGVDLKYEVKVPTNFNLDLKTSGGDLVAKNIEGDFNFKTSGGDIYLKNADGNLNAVTSGGDITLYSFSGNAEVSTSGGDIEVDADNGNVIASTSGGDILLKASNGEIKAKTSGGDITLDYSGNNLGINLYTSGGDIDAKLPSNLDADVDIKTSGGDLISNFSQNKMSKISKSKLVGKFNNGGNTLKLKTSGGDIKVDEK